MDCPRCQSAEINQAGICQVCGFQEPGSVDGAGKPDATPPSLESTPARDADNACAPGDELAELPEWRVELSRRLQEIRLKRETDGEVRSPVTPTAEVPAADGLFSESSMPPPAAGEPALPEPPKPRKLRRTPRVIPFEPTVSAAVAEPEPPAAGSQTLPFLLKPEPAPPEPPPMQSPPPAPQVADIPIRHVSTTAQVPEESSLEELLDTFRNRQEASAEHAALTADIRAAGPTFAIASQESDEGRLILLSRTLSGLVDLIIVLFFAGSFVFSADVLEGIEVFDRVSLAHYALLLLATFFVYSLFFLGSGRQTIGMMLTDLQVVGATDKKLRASQLVVRCVAYLVGFALAGIGFLWSVFDRRSRCLHDILSHTGVRRIPL